MDWQHSSASIARLPLQRYAITAHNRHGGADANVAGVLRHQTACFDGTAGTRNRHRVGSEDGWTAGITANQNGTWIVQRNGKAGQWHQSNARFMAARSDIGHMAQGWDQRYVLFDSKVKAPAAISRHGPSDYAPKASTRFPFI